jgi:hypothetical protein
MVNFVLAVDSQYVSIINELSSRYCPVDRTVFLGRLVLLFATLIGVALFVFAFGKFRAANSRRKELAYIGACAVAAFAIGSGLLVIFGLSGCGGGSEAGPTWDWPW